MTKAVGKGLVLNDKLVNQLHSWWGIIIARDVQETVAGTEPLPIPAVGTSTNNITN